MLKINSYNKQLPKFENAKTFKGKPYYESEKKHEIRKKSQTHLISNNIFTKTWASIHKLGNAFSVYPAKGLKGDKNADFYEFLSIGAIPYIIGSASLIAVFNLASKHFSPSSAKAAGKIGKKLGVGVVFYALGKTLGQKSVNEPVRALTGIDLDRPYVVISQGLKPNATDDSKSWKQYHKVFESADFPRWDLLHDQGYEHGNRNEFFDKIAKRNGFGKLHASDQEMKPRIKQLIIDGRTWKTIAGYLWAITGVALAAQSPWEEVFVNKGVKRTTQDSLKTFGNRIGESFKQMWHGGISKSKTAGIAGKALLVAALGSSVVGTAISVSKFKSKVKSEQVINPSQKVYEF